MPIPQEEYEKGYSSDTLHDLPIDVVSALAEAMGYKVVMKSLGEAKGPDLVIRNSKNERIVVECEAGHDTGSTDECFSKWKGRLEQVEPKPKAFIAIVNAPRRIRDARKHIEQLGFSEDTFFVVPEVVYKDVVAAILAKALG